VGLASSPSIASTAACSPSGQRCRCATRPAGVVDELDLPVADEVVDVAVQQRVRVERHVDGREGVRLVLGVEVDAAEAPLDPGQPQRGEVHGAACRVGLVVHVGPQPPHGRDDLGVDHARVDVAREHQRHPRRVDQHRIGLVDDGDVRLGHDGSRRGR
jgi:hypothetical protein